MALYATQTWIFEAFNVCANLAFTSPEKRCGKSLATDLVAVVSRRPLQTSSVSAAALYRIIELHQPTLCVDEVETFVIQNDELRGILNAGHRRSSAFVIRCVGDDDEPRHFSTWAPM